MSTNKKYIVQSADKVEKQEIKAGKGTEIQILIGPDQAPNFALRRFIMQAGGGMPMHTNTVEHEQYVLCGRARVHLGDKTVEVKAGDVLFIPAGLPHSYQVLGNERYEFLCTVPNKKDRIEILGD